MHHRFARMYLGAHSVEATVDTLGKESLGHGAAGPDTVVEKSRDYELPFVLAAHGHDSLVRKQLRIRFEPLRPPERFAVFEFQASGKVLDEVLKLHCLP